MPVVRSKNMPLSTRPISPLAWLVALVALNTWVGLLAACNSLPAELPVTQSSPASTALVPALTETTTLAVDPTTADPPAIAPSAADLSGDWLAAYPSLEPDSLVIGQSVQGRPLIVRRFGRLNANRALVLMGGIHGRYEGLSVDLVEQLACHFGDQELPLAVYLVECINPDSFFVQTDISQDSRSGYRDHRKVGKAWWRFNARYVDLNRNWPTDSWRSTIIYHNNDIRYYAGGSHPASEPEVQALIAFLSSLTRSYQSLVVVNYHGLVYSTGPGMVQPSYDGPADTALVDSRAVDLARIYAQAAGPNCQYLERWTRYEVPGEFLHWAGQNGIIALDVELMAGSSIFSRLPNRLTQYAEQLAAIQALLAHLVAMNN